MNRRELFAAAPAAALCLIADPASGAPLHSPVMRKRAEWQQCLRDWDSALEIDPSDATSDPWGRKSMRLAEEILDLPCTGPLDFIAKMMTYSIDGTVGLDDADRAHLLWAEAFTLMGEHGPTEVGGAAG